MFPNGNFTFLNFTNHGAAHFPGGVRTDGRRTLSRVVVGFVTNELAELIRRERNSKLYEIYECTYRIRRFDEREVSVHASARKISFRHRAHAVLILSAERQFVIRLFIASRIDGSAARQ